jgi:hypothetical protein
MSFLDSRYQDELLVWERERSTAEGKIEELEKLIKERKAEVERLKKR